MKIIRQNFAAFCLKIVSRLRRCPQMSSHSIWTKRKKHKNHRLYNSSVPHLKNHIDTEWSFPKNKQKGCHCRGKFKPLSKMPALCKGDVVCGESLRKYMHKIAVLKTWPKTLSLTQWSRPSSLHSPFTHGKSLNLIYKGKMGKISLKNQ